MKKIEVRVKKIIDNNGPEGVIPFYATPGAAGADLYACLEQEMVIKPGERVRIPTGIAIELPDPDMVALIFARSGMAIKNGLALSNGVGVVDADYRGEIMVLMTNFGQEEVIIKHGERIAQMLFIEVSQVCFIAVTELNQTERGTGGFGSTGL